MEENVNTAVAEETAQPEAEAPEAQAESVAEPMEPAQEAEGSESETATPTEEQPAEGADDEQGAEDEPAEPPVVRVKFNKQERTYSTEEAAPLVEMGLKWESFKESHEKLKFLATTTGKTVGELIDNLVETNEDNLFKKLLEESDGNEKVARQLHELQKAERQRRFEKFKTDEAERESSERQAERDAENQRLAEEFLELQKETGGKFEKVKDVPKAVFNMAQKRHITLYDAYLRFERQESAKVSAAAAKQKENAESSAGSVSTNEQTTAPEADSFAAGLWDALS